MKTLSKLFSMGFKQFFDVFDRFLVFVLFLSFLSKFLTDLRRFCSTLIKNQFFLRKDFDLVFGHKNHF